MMGRIILPALLLMLATDGGALADTRVASPGADLRVQGGGAVEVADVRVKTPGVDVRTPSGGVELKVDIDGKLAPRGDWVGRAVYSIDGKRLGAVAAVANDNFYVDMGGFLGIGESRVLLNRTDVGSATDERIVLKMTEADARNLPSTDAKRAPPSAKP